MNTKIIVVLLVVILGVGGLWYFKANQSDTDAMIKDDHMTNDVIMDGDEMMEKDDSMMNNTMEANDAMMTDEEKMDGDVMMIEEVGGNYETYAPEKLTLAENGKVVLFFRASWCPTCKGLDDDIRMQLDAIPEDLTILDVNYDTETALKQKYGVTYQHTFVQVDADGEVIKKWSGSPTLSALVSEVQ